MVHWYPELPLGYTALTLRYRKYCQFFGGDFKANICSVTNNSCTVLTNLKSWIFGKTSSGLGSIRGFLYFHNKTLLAPGFFKIEKTINSILVDQWFPTFWFPCTTKRYKNLRVPPFFFISKVNYYLVKDIGSHVFLLKVNQVWTYYTSIWIFNQPFWHTSIYYTFTILYI